MADDAPARTDHQSDQWVMCGDKGPKVGTDQYRCVLCKGHDDEDHRRGGVWWRSAPRPTEEAPRG